METINQISGQSPQHTSPNERFVGEQIKKTTTIWLIAFFFMCVFLISCRQNKSLNQNIESEISNLTNKFPQLPKGNSKQSDYYKLVRSVRNGEKNFEIQLRSSPDSLDDPQQIIIFINQYEKCVAIPFFSNTYRDYWNFQFDELLPNIKRTNTDFTKELMFALNKLQLNDSIGKAGLVVDEMLYSLLHCTLVTESDSVKLFGTSLIPNHNLPPESIDSNFARQRKNYNAMSKEWHPKYFIDNYNSFLDEENHRVYQFNFMHDSWRREKVEMSIKVYRKDCNFHSLFSD